MRKNMICLMAILILVCCLIPSALCESNIETVFKGDPAWNGYEITAQAGDYALVSSPDHAFLVAVDGDGKIVAYPNAVHQPGKDHGAVSLLPLHESEMTGIQLLYGNPDGEDDSWEYFVFDDYVSDNVGDLLLRKAKIENLTMYRVEDRPEINLKEQISNYAATYGVVYSDEQLERGVQRLIEMSESTPFDRWIGNAFALFMVELEMTRSMAINDALIEDTVCDLNAIRWIKNWNDATNGWDGRLRYIVTDGQQIAWYSDVITLSSFDISLFPDRIAWAQDAFSNMQE